MTIFFSVYNKSRNKEIVSRHRLVVRTPGFHPGNRSSILRGDTITYCIFFYRGVEKWYLVGLITRRPQVQFLSPQPIKNKRNFVIIYSRVFLLFKKKKLFFKTVSIYISMGQLFVVLVMIVVIPLIIQEFILFFF